MLLEMGKMTVWCSNQYEKKKKHIYLPEDFVLRFNPSSHYPSTLVQACLLMYFSKYQSEYEKTEFKLQ